MMTALFDQEWETERYGDRREAQGITKGREEAQADIEKLRQQLLNAGIKPAV